MSEEQSTESTAPRAGRELIAAAKPFAKETRARSWFHVVETLGILAVFLVGTVVTPSWWARLICAVIAGGVIVRGFILYHDYVHNAILRGSKVAHAIMWTYGVYVMAPVNVWRQTHNYHHAHTAKVVGSHVGSYMMVTTEMWAKMSARERSMYRVYRHPLTIFFAYFTVFAYGMCVASFLRNPKKNWDSAFALAAHLVVAVLLFVFAGPAIFLFTYFIPLFVAMMLGAYLFYAQHNFPDMYVQPRQEWEYSRAALESSSYMEMGPIMRWMTGNIGYHHVHHLLPTIPFYRLPEAMAALPELQTPGRTTWWPKDVVACFRLKLWDAEAGRMVGYPPAS